MLKFKKKWHEGIEMTRGYLASQKKWFLSKKLNTVRKEVTWVSGGRAFQAEGEASAMASWWDCSAYLQNQKKASVRVATEPRRSLGAFYTQHLSLSGPTKHFVFLP